MSACRSLFMSGRRSAVAVLVLLGLAVSGCSTMGQSNSTEAQELLPLAETTLTNFKRDPDMTWFQQHFRDAKAVIIAPSIVKAGWIFGGAGGRAVVFARNPATGRWYGPGFYNIAVASVGFQAGIAVSETVTLVMTDKGFNSLLSNSVKLGGDVSVAAGPVGAGANSDVTTDFVSFSRSKGLYGGLNLDGSAIVVANDLNAAYYGANVLPPDILVRGTARSASSDHILSVLNAGIPATH